MKRIISVLCAAVLVVLSVASVGAADKAYQKGDAEELKALCVDLCMECGCCSYVCPAKRHLVQTNKLGKAMLRAYLDRQKKEQEAKK